MFRRSGQERSSGREGRGTGACGRPRAVLDRRRSCGAGPALVHVNEAF